MCSSGLVSVYVIRSREENYSVDVYIWFQITLSVTYNPSVWRAVMMPNVDNMLSIGYLGSYSFAGLKQDEIKPEDQPPSSNDWEKRE